MFFKRKQREAPSLNTTSTADISFMLLTFFLVTSSMDIDKGLTRQLPQEDKQEQRSAHIDKGRVLQIGISANNQLSVNNVAISNEQMRKHVEQFIKKHPQDHIVVIDADSNSDYATFFLVENELSTIYEKLRNNYSNQKYGHTFNECNDEQKVSVAKAYPIRISETCNIPQEKGGER